MNNRAIDYLIATKVMGWEDNGTPFYGLNGERVESKEFFNPSDNIQDAWKVVDKLANEEIMTNVKNCLDFGYRVELLMPESYEGDIEVTKETAPLAICLAALESKNVKLK